MSDINVTYYLGAGASANAIPMVSQIREYYDQFYYFIKKEIKTNSHISNKDRVLNKFDYINNNLKEHYTPDTFAKKLWLRKQNDDLIHLKFYLSLFFYWIENIYSPENRLDKAFIHSVSGGIDPRYDPFLATLLERNNESLQFPPNINFISWNYDTQLETSYSNFSEISSYDTIRDNLGLLPKPSDQGDLSNTTSRFIKLNGCSRLFFSPENAEVISPFENPKSEEIPVKWLLEFSNRMDTIRPDLGMPLINFAWETENPASQEALKEAKDVFSKTNILVIIGYSFPTFNRQVDKELFKSLLPHGTIYYQAPGSIVHELIDKLKSIWGVQNVTPVINLDQFHIPLQLQ